MGDGKFWNQTMVETALGDQIQCHTTAQCKVVKMVIFMLYAHTPPFETSHVTYQRPLNWVLPGNCGIREFYRDKAI